MATINMKTYRHKYTIQQNIINSHTVVPQKTFFQEEKRKNQFLNVLLLVLVPPQPKFSSFLLHY